MNDPLYDNIPEPVIERRRRPSWVWVVPVIAVLIGVVLLVQSLLNRGPSITIRFDTAAGLKAGQTELRFKDVVVGKVSDIRLGEDREDVVVAVELVPSAASMAVSDSRFWVVRPRADIGGVSGLDTLITGAYLAVDVGVSDEVAREFTGQDQPPRVLNNQRGRRIELKTRALGSLGIGSPIYYRGIVVGRVVGFELDPKNGGMSLQGFVEAPYDVYVTRASRFWNASGVDVTLDPNGLQVSTESLLTLVGGGVAFYNEAPGIRDTLAAAAEAPPALESDGVLHFELFENEAAARARTEEIVLKVRTRFSESMRGLAVGAPLDFRGVEVGRVTGTDLEYDVARQQFVAAVDAELYPARLGRAYEQWRRWRVREGDQFDTAEAAGQALFVRMVNQGLRAQLRTGNLITGQLYIALDTLALPADVLPDSDGVLVIPSQPGSFDQIQNQIASIVAKVDALPIEAMASDLRETLAGLNALTQRLEGEVGVEVTRTLQQVQQLVDGLNRQYTAPNAPLQQDLNHMLEQIDRATHSLRGLTDSLQRNPQSLLRGRPQVDDE